MEKFQENPGRAHWKLLKQVVRYLIGALDFGVFLPNVILGCTLEARSDADWTRDISNRRSRFGYLILISKAPILWCLKLQTSTPLSSIQTQFYSLAHYTREIIWIRDLLKELNLCPRNQTLTRLDNLGTIKWTEEMQGLRKVKHI